MLAASTGHSFLDRLHVFRVVLLAALFLLPGAVHAQVDTGSITGTITDGTGAVVSGASVVLRNEGNGQQMQTTTDSRGGFVISPVLVGRYSISVSKAGFETVQQTGFAVNIQQSLLLNYALTPGKVQQTVKVSASAAQLLQTQNATVSQLVEAKQINDLPLNGRNYIFLAQTAAGVVIGQQGGRGEDKNGRFSANGTRPTENNYLLDGIDNNSSIISVQNGKDFVVQTPIDALSEFSIQTNDYSAEFGRSSGAVMNASVKSGTNDFHGDAWEFVRNNIFDANDYFLNYAHKPNPEYRRNQFGFTQGGPVWIPKVYDGRGKTFFFVDAEWNRIQQGNSIVTTVPTLAERTSGFTNFADLISGQTGTYTDAAGKSYPAGTIFDPSTTTPYGNGNVRTPFAGNIIPSGRIDPNAVKILNLLPEPTSSGTQNNYIVAPVFTDNYTNFDARLDQNIGANDHLFARYSYNYHQQLHPGPYTTFADGSNSLVNSNLNDRSQNAVLSESHIFSPKLVNVFRLGLNREVALWQQPFGNTQGIPQQFGIQGVPQLPGNGGLPSFLVGDLTRFGSFGFIPSNKYGTVPQMNDDLTLVAGEHTLKVGFEGQLIYMPFKQPPQSRGLLNYSGQYTSVVGQSDSTTAVAQMLLLPTATSNIAGANQVQFSNDVEHSMMREYFGAYVQDDWKPLRKLTLNIGLRYDYYPFLHDQKGQLANFAPGSGRVGGTYYVTPQIQGRLPADFTTALGAEGITVQQATLGNAQKLNFAPRAGFAYQLSSRLVVRGGYGLSYGGIEDIGGSPLITENFPIEYVVTRTANSPVTPITADNSVGLLESSFTNLSLDPATVNTAGIGLIGYQRNWQTPYTQSQNLMLQYAFTNTSTLTVGYVGSTTRHLETVLDPNQPLELLPPATNLSAYVPYQHTALGGNYYTLTGASSSYNSLQATVQKQESHGLTLLANITWEKTLTDARDPLEGDIGGYRAPWLPGFGIGKDKALADYNVPLVFHVDGTYLLPFGDGRMFAPSAHGLLNALIGGWSTNWIATVERGQPFTVGCSRATSSGFGCNALMNRGVNPYANSGAAHFVNAAAFANPVSAVTQVGQTDVSPLGGSPTQVSGPSYRRLDASIFKHFSIGGRFSMELRGEVFNVTNTANFALPGPLNFANTTNFGQITATRDSPDDPREIQLAGKIYW